VAMPDESLVAEPVLAPTAQIVAGFAGPLPEDVPMPAFGTSAPAILSGVAQGSREDEMKQMRRELKDLRDMIIMMHQEERHYQEEVRHELEKVRQVGEDANKIALRMDSLENKRLMWNQGAADAEDSPDRLGLSGAADSTRQSVRVFSGGQYVGPSGHHTLAPRQFSLDMLLGPPSTRVSAPTTDSLGLEADFPGSGSGTGGEGTVCISSSQAAPEVPLACTSQPLLGLDTDLRGYWGDVTATAGGCTMGIVPPQTAHAVQPAGMP